MHTDDFLKRVRICSMSRRLLLHLTVTTVKTNSCTVTWDRNMLTIRYFSYSFSTCRYIMCVDAQTHKLDKVKRGHSYSANRYFDIALICRSSIDHAAYANVWQQGPLNRSRGESMTPEHVWTTMEHYVKDLRGLTDHFGYQNMHYLRELAEMGACGRH